MGLDVVVHGLLVDGVLVHGPRSGTALTSYPLPNRRVAAPFAVFAFASNRSLGRDSSANHLNLLEGRR